MLKLFLICFIQLFFISTLTSLSTDLDAKLKLHVPPLEDLVKTLRDGLAENFDTVQISIIDCPDLTQKPFCLAAKGLGGSARLVDIGGPGYLFPSARQDKLFNVRQVCNTSDLPNAFVLGSGAGPLRALGYNSEMIHNAHLVDEHSEIFKSYSVHLENISSIPPYSVKQLDNETGNEFALMANLILTEGKTDKVLKVVAKKRTGKENFITSMRLALKSKYGTKQVGLGGTFVIKTGKANMHLMPDHFPQRFSSINELSDTWLQYFIMDTPLVCASTFVSHDPGLDLRMEHSHCFSCNEKNGGHYHNDTTPNEIEYEGYFTPAEVLYRIDRPGSNNFPL